MLRVCIPFCLLFVHAASAQYLGVQTWGGTDTDQLNALAVDAQGRVFALGGFRGTSDMDPSLVVTPLTAVGGQDIFLSCFTPGGTWDWATQLGGDVHDNAQGLAVDAEHVFVGGEFVDTLEAGNSDVVSNGSSDGLLACYDPFGTLLWVTGVGGTGTDYINDLAVDGAGNVLAIGYFQGTVDFDPGPNEHLVSALGSDAMFLWKVSASGNLVWVRAWSGSSSENGLAVAVGAEDDIWIGGGYFEDLDLDPGAGTVEVEAPSFEQNAFVVHLDMEGVFLFGGDFGGNGTDGVHDLKLDADGNVLLTGSFSAAGDFDPGPGITPLEHVGGPDSFVLKLAPTGDLMHAAVVASPGYDQPRALELGPAGVLVSGGYDGTIDLDPGAGTAPFTGNGVSDVYVVLLDSALAYVEGTAWGGTGSDEGMALCWSLADRRYVGGLFEYTVDFDPGAGTDLVASTMSSRDAYLTQVCFRKSSTQAITIPAGDSLYVGGAWQTESGIYTDTTSAVSGCDSLLVTELTVDLSTAMMDEADTGALLLFPNPAHDRLTLRLEQPAPGTTVEVRDATGRLLQTTAVQSGKLHIIPIAALTSGLYTVRIVGVPGACGRFLRVR